MQRKLLGIIKVEDDTTCQLLFIYYTAQPKKKFLVPWFLGLFLEVFGALIQKNALDRLHQL
jgi:hypothetical protein